MAKKRVLAVFGTRPEAIKMAPVVAALRARPERFDVDRRGHGAASRDARPGARAVRHRARRRPRHHAAGADARRRSPRARSRALDPLMADVAPDAVLVQGDTTTTFVAALAAFYHKVPVGHVEAGLRTDDVYAPFPEEVNRRLTSQLARWHFAADGAVGGAACSPRASTRRACTSPATPSSTRCSQVVAQPYEFPAGPVADALASGRRIVLMTAHRRESWGAPMERVCEAAKRLVARFPDIHVLFATHLNPAVRETVAHALGDVERVTLLPPLDYLPFVKLMAASTLILSDSGGVQEEAPSLDVPALCMRDVTERPEAVEAGAVKLVGTDVERIVAEASLLLTDAAEYARMARGAQPVRRRARGRAHRGRARGRLGRRARSRRRTRRPAPGPHRGLVRVPYPCQLGARLKSGRRLRREESEQACSTRNPTACSPRPSSRVPAA